MPCRSEYLAASNFEIEMSRVCCLLDEIFDGKKIDNSHWNGYHPLVYNKVYDKGPIKEICDQWVERLCTKCQSVDIKNYSLELQIWWRDHLKADKERLEAELRDADRNLQKDLALAKLTDYEKQLLGLK